DGGRERGGGEHLGGGRGRLARLGGTGARLADLDGFVVAARARPGDEQGGQEQTGDLGERAHASTHTSGGSDGSPRQATMLTNLGTRTMTFLGGPSPRWALTFSEARASRSASGSSMSDATSRRSRTLPLTCTTIVTVSTVSLA